MDAPTIVPATYKELYDWHSEYLSTHSDDFVKIVICFGGDRLYAIQNGGAFFAKVGDEVIGVVSWSPTGEYGTPGIIGLWVDPRWRRRKRPEYDVARNLMIAAIDALLPVLEHGQKIRVDLVYKESQSVVSEARLGKRVEYLEVHRCYF